MKNVIIAPDSFKELCSLNGKLPYTVLTESLKNSNKASVVFITGGNELSQKQLKDISVGNCYSIIPLITDDVNYAMENAGECLNTLVENYFNEMLNC